MGDHGMAFIKKYLFRGFLLAIGISVAACVIISRRIDVQKVDPRNDVEVKTPVKAHLKDGSTVVYRDGVKISGGIVRGEGVMDDITLKQQKTVREIPLDSIAGMESYRTGVNKAESILVSSAATAGVVVGAALISVAIFGSCPTVYSDDGKVEEAELFSSSIAPLFEARDLDRLHAQPDARGTVRLEVRNEAMETHYINHLQILEALHAPDEYVLPDIRDEIVAVRNLHAPDGIVDRRGQSAGISVASIDGDAYATDSRTVDEASAADMDDWLEFTTPVDAGAGSTTLVFRLRNSLLGTTLMYDVMLGPAGARALDWMNRDLANISTAVKLGRWFERRSGLHIAVFRNGRFQEVARVPDTGPISWHDVAASIPVLPGEESLRIRISFLADHWRIDRIGVAETARIVQPRTIPISEVVEDAGREAPDAQRYMSLPDDRYLQTNPGQRVFVDFNTGPSPVNQSRTFLLSSQGYYTEWIRGKWIETATATEPFVPTDESLLTSLRLWSRKRGTFEKQFREARVPVG